MEIINGIKTFHDYKLFFSWINNYNGELRVTVGGDVYCCDKQIAKFNFVKK